MSSRGEDHPTLFSHEPISSLLHLPCDAISEDGLAAPLI